MHQAEQNLAVAAASILARAWFLEKISTMSKKYTIIFPFGASAAVIKATIHRRNLTPRFTARCKNAF
jgi:ribonuclease HIII